MPGWLALLLGILQGATEFLPISSSGHLRLVEAWFGLQHLEHYLFFDIACHLGTACATIAILWRDLCTLDRRTTTTLFLATLPLLIVAPFASAIARLGASPSWLGAWFFVTAALLFTSEWRATACNQIRTPQALLIGSFQVLALLPGLSRSGATLTAARWSGVPRQQAARYCFLLSLPAILGAAVVGGIHAHRGALSLAPLSWSTYAIGFAASLVVGALSLRWLLALLERRTLRPFGWYCLALGVITLAVLP